VQEERIFFLALSAEKGIIFFFCSNAGQISIFFALLCREMFFSLQRMRRSWFLRKKRQNFAKSRESQHRDFEKTRKTFFLAWIS
jgi:hypothetical protein